MLNICPWREDECNLNMHKNSHYMTASRKTLMELLL
uniref:Uncharacterized protein n=1 Tax=Arundo donax TaxID=35708 RepID=A0A0A9C418_ARUDO